MRVNSQFVALVLFAFRAQSAQEITPDMIDVRALVVLQEEMTSSACLTFANLCEAADETCSSVYLSADSPLWEEGNFDTMDQDARIIFRRIQIHYGREICFEEDGMVVFPHSNFMKTGRKDLALA